MRNGAQDYLIKNGLSSEQLKQSIRYSIERHKMVNELENTIAKLERTRRGQVRLKEQFLSHVSHELRSPLAAIYQFITIVLDGLSGDINEEQREHLGIALRNVKQLRSMIDELLEVTRAEIGKLSVETRRICLDELIRETIDDLGPRAEERGRCPDQRRHPRRSPRGQRRSRSIETGADESSR